MGTSVARRDRRWDGAQTATAQPTAVDWTAATAALTRELAGTGYAGLQQMLTVRPDIVKLDRHARRPRGRGGAPVVCTNARGQAIGVLDTAELVEAAIRLSSG